MQIGDEAIGSWHLYWGRYLRAFCMGTGQEGLVFPSIAAVPIGNPETIGDWGVGDVEEVCRTAGLAFRMHV